jgi:hypothetical protein
MLTGPARPEERMAETEKSRFSPHGLRHRWIFLLASVFVFPGYGLREHYD